MSNRKASSNILSLAGYTTSFPHATTVSSNVPDPRAANEPEPVAEKSKPKPLKKRDAPRDQADSIS